MIDTKEKLKKVLKLISEESVKLALENRVSYEEEARNQKKLSSKFLLDEDDEEQTEEDPLFPDEGGSGEKGEVDDLDFGDEEGGDEEPTGDEFAEPGAGEEDPMATQAPAPEQPQKQYKSIALDLKLGEITVDGVGSVLNLLRGGRSFKDPNVAKEFRKYFEGLTEAEKLALATFISALKDIAVGESADQAPDPSDPQTNLQISAMNSDMNTQQQAQQPQQNTQQAAMNPQMPQPQQVQGQPGMVPQQMVPMPQQMPPEQNDELEDTQAPIVVGRRNESVNKEFREKIRELIKRGQSL